ncbi:ThiF family adenylyltransferase [Staphylococcus sp. ACRSN]|uniref:ThiF family adenylyltransferase n=1 Tax=Staphylococcus sp. ACRSN TaxID=2918214 RepID=UPI001EF2F9E9|nr:ThiF family adenylyltransferase [Staphylococcus sp. ACRSN]
MDLERYSRQILYKHIGQQGQAQILNKHVLIIGMGALGTHLAESLVRTGVGEITIVDRDYIEPSNLQRQTLFTEQDAMSYMPKVVAASEHLKAIRSDIVIHQHIDHVDAYFLETNAKNIDLILDATDNFETRQLINDFAYANKVPWIYGGVVQSTYVEAAFIPGETPCFNCLVPNIPTINMTCDTVGVIQPAVTMTTSLQMKDALKIMLTSELPTKLTYGDLWEGSHHSFGFSKMRRATCPTCGERPTYPYLHANNRNFATLCGRDTIQYQNSDITQEILESFLIKNHISYQSNPYMIRFKYNGHQIVSFKGGRMLIHGMTNPNDAKTLINQLFG